MHGVTISHRHQRPHDRRHAGHPELTGAAGTRIWLAARRTEILALLHHFFADWIKPAEGAAYSFSQFSRTPFVTLRARSSGRSFEGSTRYKPARAERVRRFLRAARQSRLACVLKWAQNLSRRYIIGRPALILKAWPSTHDTISHFFGVDDGEALPFA